MEDVEGETDAAGAIVPAPAAPSTKASASKKKSSPRAQQTSATSTPPATAVVSSSVQVSSQSAATDSVPTPIPNVSTGAPGEAGGATTEPLAGTSVSSEVSFSFFPYFMYLYYVSGALVASITKQFVVLLLRQTHV